MNPNTRTCPIFRSRRDAEITRGIYERVPVLIDENDEENGNPWSVTFRQGLFNMTSDSGLFRTAPGQGLVPLYEAKLIHQFDHRWATYENSRTRDSTLPEKQDPDHAVTPRYWVPEVEVNKRLAGRWDREWLLGWRDITNSTNERSVIAAIIPRVGVGHTICRSS